MKNFFKKLGFRKMDEMEQHIAFKAQRNAFMFLELALLGWSFYESYKVYTYQTRLNPFPCLILSGALVLQGFSQLIMTRNAVKDDEDSCETWPLFKILLLCLVIAAVIISFGVAFIIMGVKL